MAHQGFPNGQDDLEDRIDAWVENLAKKLFGGGNRQNDNGDGSNDGGGGGSSFNPMAYLYPILTALVLFGAWTSFYVVDVSEQAVVTRFGKYLQTVGPGPHFKMPFGVDRHFIVASKVTLQEQFGFRSDSRRATSAKRGVKRESLMLTGDLNVADVEWAVQYRIADPWKYLFHARDVTRTIRDVSMSIMRRVVGDRLAGEVLTTGRVEIASEAEQLTQQVLDQYDLGLKIEQVILQDVNPPDPVKPAFNEVNAAKQEQEEAINNAERQYNKIIPEARGKAEQVIANARAYEIEMVNRARGDAKQFRSVLKEYRSAPVVTRERLYIETMEKIFTDMQDLKVVDPDVKGVLPIFGGAATVPAKRTGKEGGAS